MGTTINATTFLCTTTSKATNNLGEIWGRETTIKEMLQFWTLLLIVSLSEKNTVKNSIGYLSNCLSNFINVHFMLIKVRGFECLLNIIWWAAVTILNDMISILKNELPVQVRCMIQDAQGWCTGMTQRDGMEREVGGGFRMGNKCTPVVDSCWYMAKPIQYCKERKKTNKNNKSI